MMGLTCVLVFLNLVVLILAQMEAAELKQLDTFVALSQGPHVAEYLNRTSGCIQNHILNYGDRGSPRRPCRKVASAVAKDLGIVRKTSTVENTCSYSFYSFTVISLSLIQITTKVKDCATDSWTSMGGGSSLRMELTHESATPGSCSLQCVNGENYIFHCAMTYTPSTDCNSLCGYNVSATVDFEHFTAFDEVAGLGYGLNKPVINHPLPPLTATDPNFKPKPNERWRQTITCCAPATSVAQPYYNLGNLPSSTLSIRATLDRFAAVYFIGSSHTRYLWDTLVHDHYNASALLAQLPQHHADETVANTWYINNYFSMELPALLRDICTENSVFAPATTTTTTSSTTTSSTGNNVSLDSTVVFVLETGSWDLDFNPAQNILLFPNSSTAVVNAILEMTGNNYRCHGHKVEFVWSTAVPIPECLDVNGGAKGSNRRADISSSSGRRKEKSCFDKGYRNNYAIRAVNQYFIRAFDTHQNVLQLPAGTLAAGKNKNKKDKKKAVLTPPTNEGSTTHDEACRSVNGKPNHVNLQPHPRVHIVDAFAAIYPHRNDNVCGLHYLCCKHHGKSRVDMQYSPGGVEWMGKVLETLAQIANQA